MKQLQNTYKINMGFVNKVLNHKMYYILIDTFF